MRLVRMRTIIETALGQVAHHLGEVVRQLGILNIDQAEALNTRGVNYISAIREGLHRRKSCGMLTLMVALRNLARTDIQSRLNSRHES